MLYWAVLLVLYRTGVVVTPVLHVGAVLNVLHQMRTPKLHDHNDKNPQKQEILIITNNKNIKDALTYKTGTDGDEKGTRELRNASVLLCKQSCDDSVMQSSCMMTQYTHKLLHTFLHAGTKRIFNMHGTQYPVLMP